MNATATEKVNKFLDFVMGNKSELDYLLGQGDLMQATNNIVMLSGEINALSEADRDADLNDTMSIGYAVIEVRHCPRLMGGWNYDYSRYPEWDYKYTGMLVGKMASNP